jgi:hypothetical protein
LPVEIHPTGGTGHQKEPMDSSPKGDETLAGLQHRQRQFFIPPHQLSRI